MRSYSVKYLTICFLLIATYVFRSIDVYGEPMSVKLVQAKSRYQLLYEWNLYFIKDIVDSHYLFKLKEFGRDSVNDNTDFKVRGDQEDRSIVNTLSNSGQNGDSLTVSNRQGFYGSFVQVEDHKNSVGTENSTSKFQFSDRPIWFDEFDYIGLPDTSKWSYDIGSKGNGWGNNELQYYTNANPNNVYVKDGVLAITARLEKKENLDYTSTRLISKHKGDFLYGRFEARAKVPKGRGTWPAIWMLPTNWGYGSWPNSGEIDILEHVGYDQDVVHISVHTKTYHHSIQTQKTAFTRINRATEDFHLYRVDWTPSYIKGFIDNIEIFHFNNENKTFKEWPFDQTFHWLINLAIGGSWGGLHGIDESVFPAKFEIDYVRVYNLIK